MFVNLESVLHTRGRFKIDDKGVLPPEPYTSEVLRKPTTRIQNLRDRLKPRGAVHVYTNYSLYSTFH